MVEGILGGNLLGELGCVFWEAGIFLRFSRFLGRGLIRKMHSGVSVWLRAVLDLRELLGHN